MKKQYRIEQKALFNLLAAMQPICTKRTTIDATSSIVFQVGHRELVLKSTDLEISLQASCTLADSTLGEPETFMVAGRRIFEIVKELDNEIVCELVDNQLTLTSGDVHLALHIKSSEEFPPFPERIENLMHIDAKALSDMLDSVAFLIPQNNANPALNGLFLEISTEGLTMTATDGHCLAQIKSSAYILQEPKSWLLPRRAIFELKKILETSNEKTIFLGTCGNQLVFSGEVFNFFSKLLVDQFPQYKAILDKDKFHCATVDKARLTKTLRRSACLLSGQFLATKFGFEQHAVHVSMQNKEVGTLDERLPINGFNEDAIDVRFYAPYLLNGLQAFSDESITFYLKNNSKPIIFESEKNSTHLTYLVMPVSPTAAH